MSDRLTPADLDRLEALAAEATPGPWWVADTAYFDALGHEASSVFWGDRDGPGDGYDAVILIDGWTRPRDAAFIAAARAAIPALVREVREARERIGILEASMRKILDLRPEKVIHAWPPEARYLREEGATFALADVGRIVRQAMLDPDYHCKVCGTSDAVILCRSCTALTDVGPHGNVGQGPTDVQRAERNLIEVVIAWFASDWYDEGEDAVRHAVRELRLARLAQSGGGEMSDNYGQYMFSSDDELGWDGVDTFATREEALAAGIEELGEDYSRIYTARKDRVEITYPKWMADTFLERMQEHVFDGWSCNAAVAWEEINAAEHADLEAELRAAFERWIEKHPRHSLDDWFMAAKVEEHEVPAGSPRSAE